MRFRDLLSAGRIFEMGQLRDVLHEPAWRESDLGQPLPDSEHACSVCLPTWDSVIGYEEEREKIMRKLRTGYPRFLFNAHVGLLMQKAQESVARAGERVAVFPTREAVQRAQRFFEKRHDSASRVTDFENLQVLAVDERHFDTVKLYWRLSGEIVSSRQAKDVVGGTLEDSSDSELVGELAREFECAPEDLFVCESGMSAFGAIHRAVINLAPAKKTLQLDFPYVDALKVQKHFGRGVVFLPLAEGEDFDEALSRIRKGEFAGIFCELPSNPLLRTLDIERLSEAAKQGQVPVIIDDTVTSHANVNVLPFADAVTTSLTKWVSGKGDVTAGLVRLNPNSKFYEELKQHLSEHEKGQNRLYSSDARVLRDNLLGFRERMRKVNRNGELVVEYLSHHDEVRDIWFPALVTQENYDIVRREEGGYGGLLSLSLKNEKSAARVFDALAWNKGPSLGNEFSLACPYTILAHYHERDWAEECGVPSHLIRLSVGIEEPAVLLKSLEVALQQA